MPLYYVCALPNKKGAGAPREFFSNDPAKIERWARQHDKPGWGVYDCPNPLKDGATARNKESIAAVVSVRVDIDKLADDDDVPLRVMACPTNLIKDHPRLIADIREQLAPDEKPAAIVLDTLNRSLIGSESKDADIRSTCLRIPKRSRAGWPFKPNPVSKRRLPNKLLANLIAWSLHWLSLGLQPPAHR